MRGTSTWTEEDTDLVKELYFDSSRFSLNEIARQMSRNVGTVSWWVKKLGLIRGGERRKYVSDRGTIEHPRPGVLVHYSSGRKY